MNILIIDDGDCCSLDFAMRCMQSGHKVRTFIAKDKGEKAKVGNGIIQKVPAWEPHAKWADLILLTSNKKYLKQLDVLRDQGFPVFGPSEAGAKLEIERGFGMDVLKKHGIDVPPYKVFKNLDDAEKHVWKSQDRSVFKTLGDEADKSLSYCAKTPADMINQLRYWKKKGKKLKGPVMLQDFIPGHEFGVSGFFGPGGFNQYFSECFEHKKLFPHKDGGVGPNTGEQGSALKWVKKSKLADMVLKPLEDYLLKINYVGDIDVNCIIDEQGKPWPLEFTCRLGWPAFWIMTAQMEGDPAQWMVDLLDGKDTQEVTRDVGIGVVIAQPNYPYGNAGEKAEGHPVYGITEKNIHQFHPVEIMAGKAIDMKGDKPAEKDMFLTTGEYIACITGLGPTVKDAMKDCYRAVDEIHVSNRFYRDDIGEHLKREIPELQKHKFAQEWEF